MKLDEVTVGVVVSAAIRNPNPAARRVAENRYRPAIVTRLLPRLDRVILIGLTRQPFYRSDGSPRDALPGWERIPLDDEPYVFSWRTVQVPAVDVRRVLGRLPAITAGFVADRIVDRLFDRDRFLIDVARNEDAARLRAETTR